MKNWSLGRLALVIWFAFYSLLALAGDLTPARPSIFEMILTSTVGMFIGLLIAGFMQES